MGQNPPPIPLHFALGNDFESAFPKITQSRGGNIATTVAKTTATNMHLFTSQFHFGFCADMRPFATYPSLILIKMGNAADLISLTKLEIVKDLLPKL